MKRIAGILLTMLVVSSGSGCSDDDDRGPGQFAYPLKVGNEWSYTQTTYFELDTGFTEPGAIRIEVRVSDLAGSGPDSGVFRLGIESYDGIGDGIGAEFYKSTAEGLFRTAHCGLPPEGFPKQVIAAHQTIDLARALGELDFAGTFDCGTHAIENYPDTPQALVYPWRVGNEWVFREPPDSPFTLRKKITGTSTVQVGGVKYDVYRVLWTYEELPDLRVYDDIASVGLLRREIRSDSVRYTTDEIPWGGEYGTMVIAMVLDSLTLK